ncbi:MAG: SDR family NAD(P)-dependent oxidoreductase [Gammaproteobacteria bacterium]
MADPTPGRLDGKVALITGATRGIGRATALALGRRGAALVLVGRSTADHRNRVLPGTLDEAREELARDGIDVLTIAADLASAEDVDRVVATTLARCGRCDILVNNAAFMPSGPILGMPSRRWQAVLRINAVAPLQLIQGFAPGMFERGWGRVLNVSSGASVTAPPDLFMYGSSKTILDRLTTDLHVEAGGRGVAFNAVQVGAVATEQWQYANAANILDRQGTGVGGPVYEPAAVAEAFAWLLLQPAERSGRIYTFDDLIGLGALDRNAILR